MEPLMNRRQWLGGVSNSFVVGTAGGITAGTLGTAAVMHDPLAPLTKSSWAGQGEDLLVEAICRLLAIAKPTYLDIGAFDPIGDSNTYLFYQRGSRGVLVEPNPALCERLRKVRRRDTVLMAGIGPTDRSEADYYVFPNGPQSNTFSKDQAEALVAKHGDRLAALKVMKMPMLGINRVIAEHFSGYAPDFLSIDTEGLDLTILEMLDFGRFRPAIVCAETQCDVTKAGSEIITLMHSKGYSVRAQNLQNAIFVDDRRLAS
jgi:FkbM family methyltransferase